jgi:DNA primase
MRNSFIQQALDEIDIVDLISENVTVENNKACCPFPDHQDTNPSFFIYPPDSFYCFGCKRGGTAIDYIMHRNNVTTGEAIRILCDKYNIPMPQRSDEEKKAWEKQRQEGDIVFKILSASAEYYHSRLTPQQREYFHQRGLNDETIDKFKLGYADGSLYTAFKNSPLGGSKAVHEDWSLNPNLARSYNNAGAVAREAKQSQLLLSGLFVKFSDGTIKDSFERRYMFPYWKSGQVVYFIGRRDTDDQKEIEQLPQWNRGKYKKLSTFDQKERSYISKAVRNDYFYGEDSLLEHEIGIITEGVVDCIHLLQAGYSCISPVTEEFKADDFKKLAKLSKLWKTVYIANDNEESGIGEQGAVKTAQYIFEQGLDVRIATVPRPEGVEKVDVADFFTVPSEQDVGLSPTITTYEQRKQEFQVLLDEAPNFIRWKISKTTTLSLEDKLKATREIFSHLVIISDRLQLERYAQLLQQARLVEGKRLFWSALKDARIEQAKKQKAEQMRLLEKESPQLFLKAQIEEIRKNKYRKVFEIKKDVSRLILDDMHEHGRFYKTPSQQYFWFENETKTLYLIGDEALGVQINNRYSINQSEAEYEFLIHELITEAWLFGSVTNVSKFAFYHHEKHLLYVFNNADQIYRLDGKEIKLVGNGTDGVLFLKDQEWEPFEYKDIGKDHRVRGQGGDFLLPQVVNLINFVDGAHVNLNKDEQRIMFMLWLKSLFFESLQPTKPIQTFLGPKGSGKTTVQRLLGKMLFGSSFDVTPIAKDDDFDAAITHNYIVCFDNVDGRIDWLNDRLAHTATGKMIQKRELYTTNKNVRFFPKCFLSLNAREPKFKRDDVVDRLLLFRVERLPSFRSEQSIIENILSHRDELWSELLNDLNGIVAALAQDNEPFTSQHRMADWATLAWRIAKSTGQGDRFIQLLEKMDKEQSLFLLEEDPIFLCLDAWLLKTENQGREVTASELYNDCQIIAEKEKISFAFKNVQSFGMHLRNIISNLSEFFDVNSSKRKNRWVYSFQLKG